MKTKKTLNEDDKFKIHVDPKTLKNPAKTKELGVLQKTNPNVEFDLEPTASSSSSSSSSSTSMAQMEENDTFEPEAVIEPQDKQTIKYLSNVKDQKTGEISQPFTIGANKYQMVRGVTPEREIVMAVFCHDETDDNGNNIIHPVDYFEENVVKPFFARIPEPNSEPSTNLHTTDKELAPAISEVKQNDSFGLGEYKYFLVNEKTGKFRKFKTVSEVAKANMNEDEKFMSLKELKRFFENRVFGTRKKEIESLNEANAEDDKEMHSQAIRFLKKFQDKMPASDIEHIKKNKVAQREVIAAFAEIIGVPRTGLASIITGLKVLANNDKQQPQPAQQVSENKIITKKELDNSVNIKKVIKTLKIKDIK